MNYHYKIVMLYAQYSEVIEPQNALMLRALLLFLIITLQL